MAREGNCCGFRKMSSTDSDLWICGHAFANGKTRSGDVPALGHPSVAIDLSCSMYRHDPHHHEVGPLMYCNRTSAPRSSRGFGVSMWHYFVSSGSGKLRVLRVTRSP